jgi:hypothetical protein
MNTRNCILFSALLLTGFASCNSAATEAEKNAASLNMYVDSIERLTPVYTSDYWTNLNEGYEVRIVKANQSLEMLSAAEKEKLEASKQKYNTLKAAYEAKIEEQKVFVPDYRSVLRNRLFGEGIVGNDLNFGFATATNLLRIYSSFVNTVADNKDSYTREDWDEIKVLYEALDSRKNTVEKDLPKGDNLKIAGLKIKFASLKATNRDGAKAEENKEAKQ